MTEDRKKKIADLVREGVKAKMACWSIADEILKEFSRDIWDDIQDGFTSLASSGVKDASELTDEAINEVISWWERINKE